MTFALRPLWIAFFAVAPTAAFAAPPGSPAKALEEQLQKVIDDATPSVVAVVVSHSKKYPSLTGSDAKLPGKLGSYAPSGRNDPFAMRPGTNAVPDRLDLSQVENVADNQFG